MKAKSYRWPLSTLAIALLLGFSSTKVMALSLGRAQVLSALGEPLKAEIDILDITPGETNTLTTKIADPEAFRLSGLDYNATMSDIQVALGRRSDGRAFIRLSGRQAVREPFLDLVLEAKWSSGRILRDYTLLFDPPKLRAASTTPVAPPAMPAPADVQIAPAPAAAAAPPTAPALAGRPAAAKAPAGPAASANAAAPGLPAKPSTSEVRVQRGDTAGKIAMRGKAANVSLEQMLLAMLRANPDAFIDGNINLLKAGALVKLPSAAEAQKTSTADARRLIRAQSKDFNAYRQTLASNAPATPLDTAQRSAEGTLKASVEEKTPATAAPDKLTLTQATVQGKRSEEQVAQAGNQQQAADKAQALTQNVNDLGKLAATAGAQTGQAAPPAQSQGSAPTGTAIPMAAAPKAPAAPTETSLTDELLDALSANPMVPAGGAGLLVLLALWGVYRSRQRKSTYEMDSVLADVKLDDDSFFQASGVKPPDTRDGPETGSSMFYSASQITTSEEGDPTEEAAVYMAYGRDQQAEEILQEALRDNPQRIGIHRKLLELYARRQDAASFEKIAVMAKALSQGKGDDWAAIAKIGATLQPDNSLYTTGTSVPPVAQPAPSSRDVGVASEKRPASPQPVDFDLDLAAPSTPEAPAALPEFEMRDVPALDEEAQAPDDAPTEAPQEPSEPESAPQSLDLDFPLDMDEAPDGPAKGNAEEAPAKPASADNNLVEFDLGDLSLDLDTPAQASPEADALEAKLAQAEALEAQGDHEGARALIQEVIANASGDVKTKAKDTLDKM